MNDNDLGLWLQAFGGLCHLAAFVWGVIDLDATIRPFFAVSWLVATSYLTTKAGQNYEA